MRQQSKESIVILFVVGALALNYPFLELFDRGWMPFGIPLLYLYLYLLWLVIIVLLIVIVEHSQIQPVEQVQPAEREQPPMSPRESVPRPETGVIDRDGSDDPDRRDQREC
ncbi:MAG: hypothetical protein R6X17_14360 [Candidatus Competibacteraceae bacterium]